MFADPPKIVLNIARLHVCFTHFFFKYVLRHINTTPQVCVESAHLINLSMFTSEQQQKKLQDGQERDNKAAKREMKEKKNNFRCFVF